MSVIQIDKLTKYYGNKQALDNVELTIEQGKIYGLLGRNGAGKTTLLNVINNRIFANAGKVTIDGKPVVNNSNALAQVYYMMEQTLYPDHLKIRQLFQWTKQFYPKFDLSYANQVAGKFDLDVNKKVKHLSLGYTSIFKAILCLASNAEILIMDEPVLGLDANYRELLYKEVLTMYSQNPKTIIVSTHLIAEIGDILEVVIVLHKGKVLVKKPVDDLLASAYMVAGEGSRVDQYIAGKRCISEDALGSFKSVTVLEPRKDHELANKLDLEFHQANLQKLFINLTNS